MRSMFRSIDQNFKGARGRAGNMAYILHLSGKSVGMMTHMHNNLDLMRIELVALIFIIRIVGFE